MSKEENPQGKNSGVFCKPVWLRLKLAFDAGWFRAAGFFPQDLPARDWPGLLARWRSVARVGFMPLPRRKLLLAELPACVEEETDAHFSASPFLGYAHNVLAQTLCRDLARTALGEAVACAPFPRLSPDERAALARLGVLSPERPFPALLRRYAILTSCPPAGGCFVCALAPACPRQPLP